jgi:hypothetical protein
MATNLYTRNIGKYQVICLTGLPEIGAAQTGVGAGNARRLAVLQFVT